MLPALLRPSCRGAEAAGRLAVITYYVKSLLPATIFHRNPGDQEITISSLVRSVPTTNHCWPIGLSVCSNGKS